LTFITLPDQYLSDQMSIFKNIHNQHGTDVGLMCRNLENLLDRINRFSAHLDFNYACKSQNLIPKSLLIRSPVKTTKGLEIILRAQKALLQERIQENKFILKHLNNQSFALKKSLTHKLDDQLLSSLFSFLDTKFVNKRSHIKGKHDLRLATLGYVDSPQVIFNEETLKKFVVNLSSKSFTTSQLNVLALDPQFNLPNFNKKDKHKITSHLESIVLAAPQELQESIRNKLINVPLPNSHKSYFGSIAFNKTLSQIKKDKDIIVTRADKGNTTVILNRSDYLEKMAEILDDSDTYKKVDVDPTPAITKIYDKLLKGFFFPLKSKSDKVKSTYKFLLSTNGAPPLLYGLPKLHKPPKMPCRPIVDFTPSPLRNLSNFLNSKLQPLSGKLSSHIKNSMEFMNKLKDVRVDDDELMVSFDVKALYPSIPYDLALKVCSSYIYKDPEFEKSIGFSIITFLELLKFCMENTYFHFNDQFYRQSKGLPMGASMSVTVANLVMEYWEVTTFQFHTDLTPKYLDRYIDDIFSIIKKENSTATLKLLNDFHPDIQFTTEEENSNCIPFLDALVSRTSTGELVFTVYRKPSHSGRYLNFASSNPISHKMSVISSLFHRASNLCSNKSLYLKERDVIIADLNQNGYPSDLIKKIEQRVWTKKTVVTNNSSIISSTTESQIISRMSIPFYPNWSQQISRICAQFDIKLTFKPMNKISSIWGNHKFKLSIHSAMNSIYSISCLDCDGVYVGETNNFMRRIKEHQGDVRLNKYENSALADHAFSLSHAFDFNNHVILANDNFYLTRKLSESYFIQSIPNTINKHPGSLPSLYITSPLFRNFQQ
jgi:hypothetical protein